MTLGNVDGFEDYRRERERRRRMNDDASRPVAPGALRELQEVEAREERDRVLNRDVHDFFEAATRTAANIVQKVAANAKVEIEERLSTEMEEFLLESLQRMQHLVASMLRRGGEQAEALMEPSLRNLAGAALDAFRIAGTAASNKHLGEDPQATDLDAVRREFRAKAGPAVAVDENAPIVPVGGGLGITAPPDTATDLPAAATPHGAGIEQHLVAELADDGGPGKKRKGKKGKKSPETPTTAEQDLDRFMAALKSLVQQGKMTREEAKAAWEARLATRSGVQ